MKIGDVFRRTTASAIGLPEQYQWDGFALRSCLQQGDRTGWHPAKLSAAMTAVFQPPASTRFNRVEDTVGQQRLALGR